MYFETHAHYDDARYDSDRESLLLSMQEEGVDYILNAGADMDSTRYGISLSQRYSFVYNAAGVHPHEVKNMTDGDIALLEEYCKLPKTVAVGEIGLDYFYDYSPREEQRYWFTRQLELCPKVNLPVIIHSRCADDETYEIIKKSGVTKGVVHCFSGNAELAMEYVELGYYIGVGGMVTFPKARNIVEAVSAVPIEKILIETDCPYLSPVPHRGERNISLYLKYICNKIAEIKGISVEKAAAITKQNALALFDKIIY